MPSLSEETRGAVTRLMPGATIGIVGGGQLGRMMALSAKYMGFRVGVLDPTPDCPTAQVGDFQIVAAYDDKAAIRELAAKSDVLTYEFENVDADALDEVRGSGEGQCAVPQGTDLLRVTQNRIAEKSFINDHGIATAPWRAVNSRADLRAAVGAKERQIEELEGKLRRKSDDYDTLKMMKMVEVSDDDIERTKNRLAALIRDVNKCIAILSEQK